MKTFKGWTPSIITLLGLTLSLIAAWSWHSPALFAGWMKTQPLTILWWALALGIFGRALDLLDGWIARWLGVTSYFGAWLDQMSDKIGIYASLAVLPNVNPWLFGLNVGLDVASVYLRIADISGAEAKGLGKSKALFQSLSLAFFALASLMHEPILTLGGNALLILAGVYALESIRQKSGNVANFATCWNAISGCLAITATLQGLYFFAFCFFIASGFFDWLDGFLARKFNLASTGGGLLDDLADAFAFGLAPAILVAAYSGWTMWGLTAGCVFAPAVWRRLYEFIKNPGPDGFFKGLPCPSGAGIVYLAVVSAWHPTIVIGLALIASALMLAFEILWPKQASIIATLGESRHELALLTLFALIGVLSLRSPIGIFWGGLIFYLPTAFRARYRFVPAMPITTTAT